MVDEGLFQQEFVREYLRYCQRDVSTITGLFECEGQQFIWGAIAEYGPPNGGGLLVELWSTANDPGETADFRFWHARETKNGMPAKGRVVLRDELGMLG